MKAAPLTVRLWRKIGQRAGQAGVQVWFCGCSVHGVLFSILSMVGVIADHFCIVFLYSVGYTLNMNQILETEIFSQWLEQLKDQKAKDKVLDRIDRTEEGNFGDHKSLGDHVSEMRLTQGPGYRVYYTKIGNLVFLLLCGGTKPTQKKDIKIAKEMAADLWSGNE